MGELGLIGITLPEEYGCANASYVAYVPEPRPLRHSRGSAGRRRRLHASRAAIHARPQAVQPAVGREVQKKLADMQTEISLGLRASLRVGR